MATEKTSSLQTALSNIHLANVGFALLLIVAGFILAKLARKLLQKTLSKRLNAQQNMLLQRITYYAVLISFFVMALQQLGFKLGVLLGAAGIFTVAIGFASQTSVSNIISGFFLLAERPFVIGDVLKVGNTTGEVVGIDLISLKLRTFQNTFVRIPNETMIKSEIQNLTRYPRRRIDLVIGIGYQEDLDNAKQVLLDTAAAHELVLKDPEPSIFFIGFQDSSIDLQLSVWAKRDDYGTVKHSLPFDIKRIFNEKDIELAFPQISLSKNKTTEPIPIKVVS